MGHATANGETDTAAQAGATDALLEITEFGIGYGNRHILADIAFEVPAKGITVLMGPSGTGKSTLLHWLAGLPAARRHHTGRVLYRQTPIEQADRRPVLMQQKAQDLRGRLGDVLAASLRNHLQASPTALRAQVVERLHALGQGALESRLDTVVAELPMAELRLAGVLQAVLGDGDLVLIDEPTHGLDAAGAERVLDLIERIGRERACLVTTHHQMHARRLAQHVVLLAGGRVQVADEADAFFANRANHPVLAQFLRTGSCSVPSLNARPEDLAEDTQVPATVEPAPATPPAQSTAVADPVARLDGGAAATTPPAPAESDDKPLVQLPVTPGLEPIDTAPPSINGPTGFHWLVRGRLAGCPKPGAVLPVDHDLALLRRMGITLLVNLTERDFPADALARHGLKGYAVRIEDRRAPPLLWTKLLLAKMEGFMRNGEIIAVHCLAGLGRTGTILGAWLVKEGLTANEALRRLRSINPGFVQSEEQEALLQELEDNLLVRMK